MNILIVDDDPEIRLIAGHMLRAAGHSVQDAADAAAAGAACAAACPDLLLMDVMLGEEDGVTVARELARLCAHRPHVVFLTGVARPEQLDRLRAEQPAGIVQKPFDPGTLAETLRRCTQGAS